MSAPYTKTTWIEDVTKTDPTNLTNIENGIYLASAPVVTSLPASPVDGQECNYLADVTAGVIWHLIYRSASGKWHYTGGPPLASRLAGSPTAGVQEGTASTAFTDLTTVGPSVVVPLAGDYICTLQGTAVAATQQQAAIMGVSIGGATPDLFSILWINASGFWQGESADFLLPGLTAGATLKTQYRVWIGGANGTWGGRSIGITPVKVG